MRVGTTILFFLQGLLQSPVSAGFEDVIAADQMTLEPSIFLIYTKPKLSWNDADTLCRSSSPGRSLFHILTDEDLTLATVQGKLKFTSLWIGLTSTTISDPTPVWGNCQPYNGSFYRKAFESPHNQYSQTKRCALWLGTYQWEWRNCGEYHGFACANNASDGNILVEKNYFPKCGSEERSFCPKGKCIQPQACSLPPSYKIGPYEIYEDMPLTWNDAFHACLKGKHLSAVDRLATITRLEFAGNMTGWIGLVSYIYNVDRIKYAWTSCTNFTEDKLLYWEKSADERRRCAFLTGIKISWLPCSERHVFICETTSDISNKYIDEEHLPLTEEEMDFRNCTDVLDYCMPGFYGCTGLSSETSLVETEKGSDGFCVKSDFETTTFDKSTLSDTEPSSTPTTPITSEPDRTTVQLTTGTDMVTTGKTTVIPEPEITTADDDITDTESATEMSRSTNEVTTEDTALDVTTEVPEHNIYSCNQSCNCRCKCVTTIYVTLDNWTILQEQKSRWISAILDDLSLNKSSFSATRRRYSSAEDTRESVATIGSLGIIVLVVVLLGIILLDLSALITDFRLLSRTLCKVFHR